MDAPVAPSVAHRDPAHASGTDGTSRFGALRSARRRSLAVLREHAALVRPGPYVPAGDMIWRHLLTPVPDHLRRTKGLPGMAAPSGAGRVARMVHTARDLARRGLLALLPPAISWLRNPPGAPRGTYPLAAAAFDGGLVLLDPAGGSVAHCFGDRVLSPGYVELRHRYERHVPTPAFEVHDGGGRLVEDYVRGRHFLEVEPAVRLAAVRDLFGRYTALTRAERRGTSAALVDPVRDALEEVAVPADLDLALRTTDLWERARDWPLVPTATDANVKNLILVDGVIVPIDLGNLRLDPFFSFPVGVIRFAREGVLAAFRSGDLDEELADLLEAGGADLEPGPQTRAALLGARIALTAYRQCSEPRTGAGPRVVDLARFTAEVSGRWRALVNDEPAAGRRGSP